MKYWIYKNYDIGLQTIETLFSGNYLLVKQDLAPCCFVYRVSNTIPDRITIHSSNSVISYLYT